MKQSLTYIFFLTVSLLLSANNTMAIEVYVKAHLASSEYMFHNPYIPALPEEDGILYGDANGDGVINVLDLIAIINYIMGGNPDPFDFEAADLNNDGIVNILDVVFNVNIIMGTPGTPCPGIPTVTYEP